MKTPVYLLLIAMLLFAGCAKDEMFNDDMNLKSAEPKTIPMKAKFYSVPTAFDEYGTTTAGYLEGNFTHLGKLNPERSPYTTTNIDYTNYPEILFEMEGHLGAANGDFLFYTLAGTADLLTGMVEADVT